MEFELDNCDCVIGSILVSEVRVKLGIRIVDLKLLHFQAVLELTHVSV